MTNKDKFEAMCRKAGLRPEARKSGRAGDICLAYGFTRKWYPHFRKFGAERGEYPDGALVAVWAVFLDDYMLTGRAMPLAPDPGNFSAEGRNAHLADAVEDANQFLSLWSMADAG